jgi:sterol desaturase/sphingolipid hydroxylase (fatty acid hydroxylase superfamily)
MVFTFPVLVLCYFFPSYAWPVLLFHYIYEVFLSGLALDHNILIKGKITRFFAWGDYHLYHHVDLHKNYGLVLTLWDHVFGSAKTPAEGFIKDRIEKRKARGLVDANFQLENWPDGIIFGSDA